MKQVKNYILYGALTTLVVGSQSCKKPLDEYNPANATADATWTTPEEFITGPNAA